MRECMCVVRVAAVVQGGVSEGRRASDVLHCVLLVKLTLDGGSEVVWLCLSGSKLLHFRLTTSYNSTKFVSHADKKKIKVASKSLRAVPQLSNI